jgi:hypothetical protein
MTFFYEDFESGTSKWTTINSPWHVTGTWPKPWGDALPWDPDRSPTHSIWCGQESNGQYLNSMDVAIVSGSIDLSKPRTAYLEFYHWMVLEATYDFGLVDIRKDGGTWTQIYSYSGTISPWQRQILNISSYCGSTNVQLRFRVTSDVFVTSRGWIIDDIKIYANGLDRPVLIAPANMSTTFGGAMNFTWVSLQLPVGAVNYTWQMSTSQSFSTILDQVVNIPETANRTTLQRTISLLSGTYYWRVIPTYISFTGTPAMPFTLVVFVNTIAPTLTLGGVGPCHRQPND